MPRSVTGNCLCTGVRYEIKGPLDNPLHCHCRMCRKADGAAFRSRAKVARKEFKWLGGEDLVRWYESSPGERRGFCGRCGSTMPTQFEDNPDTLAIPLAGLDEPVIEFTCHVFVGSKAAWDDITDTLPRFVGLPDF